LYEVNLNCINNEKENYIPQDLITLSNFLTIKTNEDLCKFIATQETEFAKRLVSRYMDAIVDDALLIEMVKELQISVTQAMQITKLPEQEQAKIIEELEKADISYAL
jgi:hypothetical protein